MGRRIVHCKRKGVVPKTNGVQFGQIYSLDLFPVLTIKRCTNAVAKRVITEENGLQMR